MGNTVSKITVKSVVEPLASFVVQIYPDNDDIVKPVAEPVAEPVESFKAAKLRQIWEQILKNTRAYHKFGKISAEDALEYFSKTRCCDKPCTNALPFVLFYFAVKQFDSESVAFVQKLVSPAKFSCTENFVLSYCDSSDITRYALESTGNLLQLLSYQDFYLTKKIIFGTYILVKTVEHVGEQSHILFGSPASYVRAEVFEKLLSADWSFEQKMSFARFFVNSFGSNPSEHVFHERFILQHATELLRRFEAIKYS